MAEQDSRITLLREISRSNIATVWEAYDAELDRKVLVKRIHPQYARDEAIRARFMREAKAIARLSHVNVVQIYDLREDEDGLSLVLEFIEGMNLGKLLKDRGPLPANVAATIAAHILAGLDPAHTAGIIHRDLKPENVMISAKADVKITDFGLVTLRDQPSLTQDGMTPGTTRYMAPEQVTGRELSAATDLFALGLILLEMLSGRRMFEQDNPNAILLALLNYKGPHLEEYGEAVPAALAPVLERLLDRLPEKRYGSAAEAREAVLQSQPEGLLPRTLLEDFLSGKPFSRPPVAKSVARRKAWTRPFRTASLILLGMIVIGLVYHLATITQQPAVIQWPPLVFAPEPDSTARVEPGEEPGTPGEPVDVDSSDDNIPPIPDPRPPVIKPDTIPSITVPKEPGFLTIASTPWASIYLGDSLIGTTPLPKPLTLPAGNHNVVLLNPQIGHPVIRQVAIQPGMTSELKVNLEDFVARLKIASVRPWADVYINGKLELRTPHSKTIYKPLGTYDILLRNPAYPDCTLTISFREGDPVKEIRVDLAQR
ncbi:serine/threonine protein kinase [candidate division KSB1 bacterium]|nr:MAG: serine/threonine protein kinase [candidate division KSB1 bacterium]